MNALIETLQILIPALAVFAATYFIVKSFLDNENKKREFDLKKNIQSATVPLRLQAYERTVIFLERIHPNQLILRVNNPSYSVRQLHQELTKAVRNEYDHNISQQVYVQPKTWDKVRDAKDEIIKLIHVASTQVPENGKSAELAQLILNVAAKSGKLPNQEALDMVKKEIQLIF